MPVITLLHLSDLHFRSDEGSHEFNRRIVLSALWDDLDKQIRKDWKPDFIAFTGDVAYHGWASEYEIARRDFFDPLLGLTGLSKEHLFIVPGNHDVDQAKIDPVASMGMRVCLESRDRANDFLGPRQDRTQYFAKFQAYADFVNDYFENILTFSVTEYFFTRSIEIGNDGIRVSVLGLNSAWMSGCVRDDQGEVSDRGNLLIGERQLQEALDRTAGTDLRIALLHHPVDWLHDTDRYDIEKRLTANCDIVLHGHCHVPEVRVQECMAGKSVWLPAGAIYASRAEQPNVYAFVRLDVSSGRGEVNLRRYNDHGPQGPEWTKDILSTGEERDGVVPFRLRRRTKAILPIPVVVVAMKYKEAQELLASQNEDVITLLQAITPVDAKNLLERYAEQRDGWRPFGTDTVPTMLDKLIVPENGESFQASFEFYSEDVFSDDPQVTEKAINLVKSYGCLFVVDGVSLLDSNILARLQKSITGITPKGFFLLLPIDLRDLKIGQLIEKRVNSFYPTFLAEHDEDLNPHRGFPIGTRAALRRSLRICLRELRMTGQIPPSWRRYYERVGIRSAGIQHLMQPSRRA